MYITPITQTLIHALIQDRCLSKHPLPPHRHVFTRAPNLSPETP